MDQPEDKQKKYPNVAGRTTITIYPAWCKSCGLCSAFCPGHVYDVDETGRPIVARPKQCRTCYQCELRCPDFAIQVVRKEDT